MEREEQGKKEFEAQIAALQQTQNELLKTQQEINDRQKKEKFWNDIRQVGNGLSGCGCLLLMLPILFVILTILVG